MTITNQQTTRGIGQFVRISSCISSLSRLALYKTAKLAKFQNVYYCDTDSLYLNKKGSQNIEQLVHKSDLGKWKLQGKPYTQVLFIGPKFAILINEQNKVKPKTKGVNKQLLQIREPDSARQFMQKTRQTILRSIPTVKMCQRIPILYKFQARMWKRCFKQGKVLIHNYPKACAFIPKRKYNLDGRSYGIKIANGQITGYQPEVIEIQDDQIY